MSRVRHVKCIHDYVTKKKPLCYDYENSANILIFYNIRIRYTLHRNSNTLCCGPSPIHIYQTRGNEYADTWHCTAIKHNILKYGRHRWHLYRVVCAMIRQHAPDGHSCHYQVVTWDTNHRLLSTNMCVYDIDLSERSCLWLIYALVLFVKTIVSNKIEVYDRCIHMSPACICNRD